MKVSRHFLSALLVAGAVSASAPSEAMNAGARAQPSYLSLFALVLVSSDGTVQSLDEQFTVSITLAAPPSPLGDTNVIGNPETVSEESTRVEGGETIRDITY